MKIAVKILPIGCDELIFLFDQSYQPIIEVKGVQYTSLKQFLSVFPQIIDNGLFIEFAKIVCFFSNGIEFQYIEDIESFKENYYGQIKAEQTSLSEEGIHLKDYGIFDLSTMHPPCFKDNYFAFFVRHDYLGIPYRGTLLYPIEIENPQVCYELLPLVE